MAAEGIYFRDSNDVRVTCDAAVASGEVRQLKDGRAAVFKGQNAAASGDPTAWATAGVYKMPKTASAFVPLEGGRAYWDHSANVVNFEKVNDRDFYLGRFAADATYASTECYVALNIDPAYDIDMLAGEGGYLSVVTGTAAVAAFGYPQPLGKSKMIQLTATNEAQCIDMLSVDKFATGSNWIAEFVIRPDVNGSTSAVDFNIGLANGTSTTDADAITESLFLHVDGGSTNLALESDDGTTEVAATDTTFDLTAGSAVANRVEVWFDGRDLTDIQCYVNGVLALTSTVFKLDAATGPLGLLAHLEKTTGTATGMFTIDRACVRLAQQ